MVSLVENLIATRRSEARCHWRRLTSFDQALCGLVFLRTGATVAEIAVSFGIGTETARRYANEAVAVLAALAPSLSQAVAVAEARTGPS